MKVELPKLLKYLKSASVNWEIDPFRLEFKDRIRFGQLDPTHSILSFGEISPTLFKGYTEVGTITFSKQAYTQLKDRFKVDEEVDIDFSDGKLKVEGKLEKFIINMINVEAKEIPVLEETPYGYILPKIKEKPMKTFKLDIKELDIGGVSEVVRIKFADNLVVQSGDDEEGTYTKTLRISQAIGDGKGETALHGSIYSSIQDIFEGECWITLADQAPICIFKKDQFISLSVIYAPWVG
ncbi:MAG: hypothetical protein QXP04_01170 [Candidatus Nanoarchaeia archaeon]|nr:hypothetical protein [Candidatus Jingweiarchaeum tengchongense]